MPGVFDQETFDRDMITAFLLAYPRQLVMDVVRTISVAEHRGRQAHGWKLFHGAREDLPENVQWVQIKNRLYVRSEEDFNREHPAKAKHPDQHDKGAVKQKTDTSVRKADIRCPICQSAMFREAICRGCKEGKAGFRVRLICGEDDDHTWMV